MNILPLVVPIEKVRGEREKKKNDVGEKKWNEITVHPRGGSGVISKVK